MKKNNTILMFISSLLIVFAVIFLFLFILNVIKNKNKHASVTFSALQNKIKEKEKIIGSKEKIIEIQALNDSIASHFVNTNEIDKFVGYLENMSTFTGSELVVNGIEIPPKMGDIISFKISVLGDFNEVMKTLNLLENIPYQITITQIYLNKKINSPIQSDTTKKIEPEISKWQMDISFNVLSIK